ECPAQLNREFSNTYQGIVFKEQGILPVGPLAEHYPMSKRKSALAPGLPASYADARTRRGWLFAASEDSDLVSFRRAQVTPPCRQAARKKATLRATCGPISARSCLSFSPNKARRTSGNKTKSWKSRVVVVTCSGANAGNVPSWSDCAASAKSRATACVARSRPIPKTLLAKSGNRGASAIATRIKRTASLTRIHSSMVAATLLK